MMAKNDFTEIKNANPEVVATLPEDAFDTRTPEEIRMMRDESDRATSIYDIELHPDFRAYWAHPINRERLYNAGYGYVYKHNLKFGPGQLKQNEVRILMGQPAFDAGGRVIRRMIDKEEAQFLMVIRQDLWREYQDIKSQKRIQKQTEGLKESPEELLSDIKNPASRKFLEQQMRDGTYLKIDSNTSLGD